MRLPVLVCTQLTPITLIYESHIETPQTVWLISNGYILIVLLGIQQRFLHVGRNDAGVVDDRRHISFYR